jgi:hypothetical protein
MKAYEIFPEDESLMNESGDLSGIPEELWPEMIKNSYPAPGYKGGSDTTSTDKAQCKKAEEKLGMASKDDPFDDGKYATGKTWSNKEQKWIWDNTDCRPGSRVITPVVECHKGNVLVFKTDNILVYGGGSSRGLSLWEDAMIIDMGDVVDEEYVSFAGCYYPELFTLKLIKVACKDYGVPGVGHTFWTRLVDIMKRESQDKPLKIICCCMGGHGRTGIALSILAGLFNMVPEGECPVTWVRERYCDKAVEAEKQINYIEEVTGRKVKAKAKSSWGGGTSLVRDATSYGAGWASYGSL